MKNVQVGDRKLIGNLRMVFLPNDRLERNNVVTQLGYLPVIFLDCHTSRPGSNQWGQMYRQPAVPYDICL